MTNFEVVNVKDNSVLLKYGEIHFVAWYDPNTGGVDFAKRLWINNKAVYESVRRLVENAWLYNDKTSTGMG